MLTLIVPLQIPGFGTPDVLDLTSTSDNLIDRATFAWGVGAMSADKVPVYVGSRLGGSNDLSLSGADLPPLLATELAVLGITLAPPAKA